MSILDNRNLWSKVHVNHEAYLNHYSFVEPSFDSELGWFKYLATQTPNGQILVNNASYQLPRANKVYLAHVTSSLERIVDSGRMLASSGCLVGGIYCVPVFPEDGKLRLHNLGQYVLRKEAQQFGGDINRLSVLLFEIDMPRMAAPTPIGIDYLKMGDIHFSAFAELSYLLSQKESVELKRASVEAIHKAHNLFSTLGQYSPEVMAKQFDKFYELYTTAVSTIPVLGYFLFEVLSEYIVLHQTGPEVARIHERGDLYCPKYKDMVFALCPNLTKSFNLGQFKPDLAVLLQYLHKIGVISDSSLEGFKLFMTRRLQYLLHSRFFNSEAQGLDIGKYWDTVAWDFSSLETATAPLLGHVIHYQLRKMKRFPHFYFYFDQTKALQAWNYWNHLNITLPYNAILPKGEVGINPANPYLKYKIYRASATDLGGDTYLQPEQELNLRIEPRLVELNMLLMGNRTYATQERQATKAPSAI